ncbi:MAG: adenosylcobinamide-GDP ribazoletransferase [Lachnospiraceae bacterium]|nr:adenosylcobinamide-GDP ribazoletransferase [Lachnospiraceae bacterium]
MQSIINSFIIAIAMYSKIPMPKVEWNKKNMKYTLCFFPVIGLVIGALLYGWCKICEQCGFGQVCFALVGTVIPVIVTGGIHLDGLLDTADALHSYTKKEKKLEILKDPHVGAFAVISAICFFMLYAAGLALVWKRDQLLLLGLSYIISRILSGMSLVWFPSAKEEGLLYSFSSAAHKRTVRVVLVTLLVIAFISAVLIQPVIGAVMALVAMWVWTYYFYMSKKQFGGITGDLAGYFLCLCELSSVFVVGMIGRVM